MEQIESVVFLAFMCGVPLVMLVVMPVLIYRGWAARRGLGEQLPRVAEREGWAATRRPASDPEVEWISRFEGGSTDDSWTLGEGRTRPRMRRKRGRRFVAWSAPVEGWPALFVLGPPIPAVALRAARVLQLGSASPRTRALLDALERLPAATDDANLVAYSSEPMHPALAAVSELRAALQPLIRAGVPHLVLSVGVDEVTLEFDAFGPPPTAQPIDLGAHAVALVTAGLEVRRVLGRVRTERLR